MELNLKSMGGPLWAGGGIRGLTGECTEKSMPNWLRGGMVYWEGNVTCRALEFGSSRVVSRSGGCWLLRL